MNSVISSNYIKTSLIDKILEPHVGESNTANRKTVDVLKVAALRADKAISILRLEKQQVQNIYLNITLYA